MFRASAIMCVSRIRKSELSRASTASSALQTSRPSVAVGANEGVERVAQHAARAPRHVLDLGLGRDRRPDRDQSLRALRDVDRVVADALEVARDLDRAHDEAEIARHWLLEGEQLDRQALDLDLQRVDLAVTGDDGVGAILIVLEQRVDGQIDQPFGAIGHGQEPLLERRQLVVKVAEPAGRRARRREKGAGGIIRTYL